MKKKSFYLLAVLLFLAISQLPAQAADKYWVGILDPNDPDTMWWGDSLNWSPAGLPQSGDSVYITLNQESTISYYDFPDSPLNPVLESLAIDGTYGPVVYPFEQGRDAFWNLRDGGVLKANNEFIGITGFAVYGQLSGVNSITNSLSLGIDTTAFGGYAMVEGCNVSASNEIIGESGTGDFVQDGGLNEITNDLKLGVNAGSIGTYRLSSGTLNVGGNIVDGAGTSNFYIEGLKEDWQVIGGGWNNLSVDNFGVGVSSSSIGSYELSGTNTLTTDNEQVGKEGTGVFTQTGGTNTVTNTLTMAEIAGSSGTYNLSGGILTAGNIVNNDTFNYSGGTLQANLENNGTTTLSGGGTRTVDGDVTNNGTIKVTDTTAVFTGTFTNNGEYISDPSDNYFGDLVVGDTGYFVGGAGDTFLISGDLTISSTQDTLWDTASAYLGFTGTGTHTLNLTGSTIGDGVGGNPLFGTIELLGGGTLIFLGVGSDIYIDNLVLSSGSSLDLGGSTLYYNTYTDDGGSVSGGEVVLAAVPEPTSLLLLGSGLVGVIALRRKWNN